MLDVNKLCPGCMHPREDSDTICPHCNYPQNFLTVKDSLPLFSILAGKYLLGAPLGKGGFGITYIALHLPDEKIVAIKEFFPSDLAVRDTDQETVVPAAPSKAVYYRTAMKSFSEEGHILYRLSDVPYIVHVKEQLQANGTTYLVMDYVSGVPLKKYMRIRQAPFSEEDALTMIRPILLALRMMHKRNILHRDISPENLMVHSDLSLTLIDFGAARTFSRDDDDNLTVILKRGYAPEEQYHSNSRQGPWTDLYAVCAVLYQMLTGIRPQEASSRAEQDQLTPISQIKGISLSPSVCAAIEKGLQVDPLERYPDMDAFMKDLYATQPLPVQNRPVPERSSSTPEQPTSSAPAPSAPAFHWDDKDLESSENIPQVDAALQKKKKKRRIIFLIVIVLCLDLLWGGLFFYHIRGYRYPWFIRPFTVNSHDTASSSGTSDSDSAEESIDDTAQTNSIDSLPDTDNSYTSDAADIFQGSDTVESVTEKMDDIYATGNREELLEYFEKLYATCNRTMNPDYISLLPDWYQRLSENWETFDFNITRLPIEDVDDSQLLEEGRILGNLTAEFSYFADQETFDSDETSTLITNLFNSIYTSMLIHAQGEEGMECIQSVYFLYRNAFDCSTAVYRAKTSEPETLHNALQAFFDSHSEVIHSFADNNVDFSDDYYASDDFFREMYYYINSSS